MDEPVAWLFNSTFAMYAVLSYVWVPFVALPIFVSLESIDTTCWRRAATSARRGGGRSSR